MRFTINLATRAYLDHRKINRWFLLAGFLLVSLTAWQVISVSSGVGELNRLNGEIAAMEARLNSAPGGVSDKDFQGLLAQITFFNGIIDRKSYNWLALLDQVERATPEGISLSRLQPGGLSGELKIEGYARSFSQVRAYLERLEDSGAFSQILLLSHRDLEAGERQRGVVFALSCRQGGR